MKWLNALIVFLFFVIPVRAMERASGFCENGAQTVSTLSAVSTTQVQRSYPGCTITVYQTGTLTLAPIFSDNHGTVLGNPFTASNTGLWYFYGFGRVDIRLSNAGITVPYVLGDVKLQDILYVSDFGAMCDGLTDDTSAIQAAINTAASGPTTLYIPQGTCLVSTLSLPNNTHIAGQGAGLSIIRQKTAAGIHNGQILNSTSTANIILEQFTLDGNASGQTNTNIQGLNIIGVSGVLINKMDFTGIVAAPIFGRDWTNLTVQASSFENYGSGSSTFPNTAAIQMDYVNATTPSSNIKITNNTIDGSATHVGGIKLNGDSTHTISYINVEGNYITTGDAPVGENTLAVELYSNVGFGFFHFVIANNIIRGESSNSPLSLSTAGAFGISACGAGGQFGTISHNTLRWLGTYSIELCGSNMTISGNVVDSGALSIINNTFSISAQALFSNITFTGNTIYNPVGLVSSSVVGSSEGLRLYTQDGGGLQNITVSGNSIQYLNTTPDSNFNSGFHFQCNGSSGTITDVLFDGNIIHGPGSGTTTNGVKLEQDGTCPITGTLISSNTFDSWGSGVFQSGDVLTRLIGNIYVGNGVSYGGAQDLSTVVLDPIPAANAVTAWPTLSPTTNHVLNRVGQYFQTNVLGSSAPNVVTWNTTNGSTGAIGGIISTNSRQRTQGDTPSFGWVQTSTSSLTRALYTALGACRFGVAFGPATGAGPNPPSDNTEFVAEDSNSSCISEAGTGGGVGIGSQAIGAGNRILNFFIGKATINPGTIAAGTAYQTSEGVTGCNAGDIAQMGFSGLTGSQTLIPFATTSSGFVNIQIYNFGGSPISLGSGTLTYACIQSR